MNGLEILLSRRWILKSEDKDLYYKLRDELGEIRKFASDKLGCVITENSLLIKMEKIPAVAEPFMGIREFSANEEYAFLCMLLMFLEDKDAQEQFILSQLTEYIAANMPNGVDWTMYINRRRLIRVLRYAVDQGMVAVTDGSDDAFMDDAYGEVLYENTGASRYFMRSFTKDIMEYTRPEDFHESDWFDINEDRGIARRHRVYKRLVFAPGMFYDTGTEEDFSYLKYYGHRLAEDLEKNFDCSVQIHRGSAYLLLGESSRLGRTFPGNNALSDILLLVCGEIRKKIMEGLFSTDNAENVFTDRVELENVIRNVKMKYGDFFSKNYREMPDGEFIKNIMEEMEYLMFINVERGEHQVKIYPIVGKIQGYYPGEEKEHGKNE